MASRVVCLVLLLSLQSATVQGVNIRGGNAPVAEEEGSPGFLERNLPWLATVPYLEGRLLSLAQRLDLSVLLRHDEQSLSALTPDMDKAGQQFDKAGKQFAKEFQPDTINAKREKLAQDLHPDKLRPDALADDIPGRVLENHPILGKDGKPKDDDTILMGVVSTASSILVWFVFVIVAAIIYRQTKDTSEVDLEKTKGKFKDQPFTHGPFSCFDDMDVCCWSFWCGAVQWADTMNALGSLSFWLAFTLFVVLSSINALTGITVWLLIAWVFTYFRQDLRRKLQLENENVDLAKDFAMWCCCSCCAIVQEARQVKEARQIAAA